MIKKGALEAFLARDLDESEWIKTTPRKEVESKLDQEAPGWESVLKTKPMSQQLSSLLLSVVYPGYLFFLDMGLGKTGLTAYLVSVHKHITKKLFTTLVVVPTEVNLLSWRQQIVEHSHLRIVTISGGTSEDKWTRILRTTTMRQRPDIVAIDYSAFQYIFAAKKASTSKKKKKGTAMAVLPDRIHKVGALFDCIVFDEIHYIKNHQSLRYDIAESLCKLIPNRYGLTGTPFGRNPEDFWAQFHLIDRGDTLGTTLGVFREAFFKTKPSHYGWGGVEWVFNEEKKDLLFKVIQHRSIRYSDDECTDLPKVRYVVVEVKSTPEQKKVLEASRRELVSLKEKGETMNSFIRARQICAGVLYLSDEDGIKSTIRLASSPKLEALIQKMGEIGSEKVVLFYEFTASGDLICDRLKAEKISFVRLWSGTEDKQGDFSKFLSTAKNSPRVLVAQWRLGGTGLDKMQSVSKYVMFFESPVSPIQRRQCEKRVHRIGQEQAVTVFDFCVEKSVDLKILEYIKEGKDLFDAIMDGDAEALW